MNRDLIVYQFSQQSVGAVDFTDFLRRYGTEVLPVGKPLRAMLGSMVFCVEGYDDDPREVHSIPEVRRFYSAFHEAWPYWLYFCNLSEVGSLKAMTFCCIQTLAVLKVDAEPSVLVRCDPLELLYTVAGDFPHMNLMCERAGMSERETYWRTGEVFEYFGLPFDPPEPID
ncbi:MAG: hypothetical protein PHV34_08820 [Verrucomicrobiae bacterium]|nr:hypothetical protein [Verrucomicrobiae bacterium]